MLCGSVLLVIAIVYLCYKYIQRKYSYWKSKGVPYIESQGNISEWIDFFSKNFDIIENIREWYNEHADKRFVNLTAKFLNFET